MPELKGLTNYNSDDSYGGRPRCYGHHKHLTAREVTDRRLEDTWKDHPPDTLVSVSPPVDSRRHGTFPAGRYTPPHLRSKGLAAYPPSLQLSSPCVPSLVPVHPASVMNVLAQTTATQAVVHAMAVGRQLQQTQVAKVGKGLHVEEDQTVPRTWSKEPTISGSTTVDMKEMEAIAEDPGIVISRQLEDVFTHQELPLATLNNQTPRPFGALPLSPVKSYHLMGKKEKEFDTGEIIFIELTTSLKGSFGKPINFRESYYYSYPKTDENLCQFSSDRQEYGDKEELKFVGSSFSGNVSSNLMVLETTQKAYRLSHCGARCGVL